MNERRIDWSQVWYPGPRRAFTAEEMRLAGGDGPSPTLLMMLVVNLLSVFSVVLLVAPPAERWRVSGAVLLLTVMGAVAAHWLWWRPWRRPLLWASLSLAAAMVVVVVTIRWALPAREQRETMGLTLSIGASALVVLMWFVVSWRAQQIDGRLREQAERAKAVEMAQRLAGAQLEPHFLFNTLASLQHWVDTGDQRAAPLLGALTGFLRATLPMFKTALLPARDELLAVRRYLEVMQARLGTRLRFDIHTDATAEAAQLPPGVLLTLVENAVAHGVEPQISSGHITVHAVTDGARAVFTITDNGPGLPASFNEGVGLSNARQRLQLTCGAQAQLVLTNAPGGGCRAELRIPLKAPA
jgi:signal transduction histidine kinase